MSKTKRNYPKYLDSGAREGNDVSMDFREQFIRGKRTKPIDDFDIDTPGGKRFVKRATARKQRRQPIEVD
jgi:hypothetical protein